MSSWWQVVLPQSTGKLVASSNSTVVLSVSSHSTSCQTDVHSFLEVVEEENSQNLETEPLGHDKRVDGYYAPSHLHARVSLRSPGHPGKKKRNTLVLQSLASTGLTKSRRFLRLVGPACKQDE